MISVGILLILTNKSDAAISLAALRKTETKTCPECGESRIAVIRASDLCKKCKSKLLMRERKLKTLAEINEEGES